MQTECNPKPMVFARVGWCDVVADQAENLLAVAAARTVGPSLAG
jgi:hypothetical protein